MTPSPPRLAAALSSMVTLATALAAHAQPQPRCVVQSPLPALSSVRVDIPGEPLSLDVEEVDVAEATLPARAEEPFAVRVTAAIQFSGTAPSVPVALRHETLAAGGVLRMASSAQLERVRVAPDGRGLFDAVLGGSVVARDVTVACDALRLGPADLTSVPSLGDRVTRETHAEPQTWVAARDALRFFAAPGAGAAITVSFTRREDSWSDSVPLLRVARRGPWSRVVLAANDGVATGWVSQRDLRPMPSHGSGGGSGSSQCGGCVAEGPPQVGPGDYFGPATVTTGTGVFTSPDGARWATVARAEGFRVLHRRGAPWVTLEQIPGVRITGTCRRRIERAMVPRDAVTFLPEASRDAGAPVSARPPR